MDAIDNTTVTNNSSKTVIVQRIFSTDVGKYLFLSFVTIAFLIDTFTFGAIIRTKQIPFAAKLLICITLLCNSLFLVVCWLAYIVGFLNEVPGSILTELGEIFILVSWVAVTILSVERVFCLYFPYLYTRTTSERNITKLVVGCICAILCVKLSVQYLLIPIIKQEELSLIKTSNDVPLVIFFLAVCIFINTASYIATFLVVKKHMRTIVVTHTTGNQSVYRRHFVSTRNITCIIAVFQIVHVPLLVSLCVLQFQGNNGNNGNNTYLSAVFTLIMCAVNPILYAWRFKECRFMMMKSICQFCNIFNQKIEEMRMDVYNINI